MINPTDASALQFPAETPLAKLVEQCNKFGVENPKPKLDKGMPNVTDPLLLSSEMNPYAQYPPFITSPNWWMEHNWPLAYNTDAYQQYLSPFLNSATAGATSASSLMVSSLTRGLTSASSNSSIPPHQTSSSSSTSSTPSAFMPTKMKNSSMSSSSQSASSAGGKYQSRSNCECPNCQESERVGANNLAPRKRGVHNCHIAGCGKVYNKSSHLKAHLRWHSGERPQRRRSGDAI